MKRSILFLTMVLFASLSYGQAWEKIKGVTPTATEINRVKGVTSDIQTQLNNKYDKSEAVSAKTYFYTKTQIDSILNAKYSSLQLTGSKLTYTESGKKYTAKTDSLDISAYGPELVSNGIFTNGTGWDNDNAFVTFTGGVAQINTGTTTYDNITYQTIGIQNNKTYRIEFDIPTYTSGEIKIGLGSMSQGIFGEVVTSSGHYSYNLTLNNASAPLQVLLLVFDVAFVGSIDNISVREVL